MADFNKRVNSIIVKNLPTDFTAEQLNELFSQCGQVLSTKVLPFNHNYEGECGFVNFTDAESCNQAVERLNNHVIGTFTLRVSHSMLRSGNNSSDRPQNGFRTMSATNMNSIENNGTPSPETQSRSNAFRTAASEQSPINTPKPAWNGTSMQQSQIIGYNKSPIQNGTSTLYHSINIHDHELFDQNTTHSVYLSNLEVPNVVFAATLDDYVNATLLITQMNKHEQLAKVQANSYRTKLIVGQICAAQFNSDWYRARVIEIDDTRVRVQYIDWGNTGWCDSILGIRPLPNEYYKDSVLCEKCILDGVSSKEKLSEEQTNAILRILVLDVKLEMTVLRIENNIPYVQLNLGERNLNNEIRALISSNTVMKSNLNMNFDSNQPEVNLSETHYIQLTTVDTVAECFHVILMRDSLPTIMNVLKDWNAKKQPLIGQPKSDTLICAQYDVDDLWYRAWIKKVTNNDVLVYFVDFGNEDIVSTDRLSECPDVLKSIPWQSIQIKLANIKLTDDERYMLLRDFETERFEMKILEKNQNIYLVELLSNGKSLIDHVLNVRKQQQQSQKVSIPTPKVTSDNVSPNNSSLTTQVFRSTSDTLKQSTHSDSNELFEPTGISTYAPKKPVFTSTNTVTKPSLTPESNNETTLNENVTTLITEQRRQNRLLEQVIAAINTTNALLTQLVQR
ncbi:hypothetical protein I4U23_002123 [Adineta vaga]|nr:hypothetical protein I4U23_002123 [Adineta vaga]